MHWNVRAPRAFWNGLDATADLWRCLRRSFFFSIELNEARDERWEKADAKDISEALDLLALKLYPLEDLVVMTLDKEAWSLLDDPVLRELERI